MKFIITSWKLLEKIDRYCVIFVLIEILALPMSFISYLLGFIIIILGLSIALRGLWVCGGKEDYQNFKNKVKQKMEKDRLKQ